MKWLLLKIFFTLTVLFILDCVQIIAQPIFNQPYSSSTVIKSLSPHSPDAEALGKFGDIPVGLYTGVPNISIPLYSFKLKNLTIPISIDYHSSGVKVDEIASSVGLGWALNAGGIINQIVYGLSDLDYNGSGGWLNPPTCCATSLTKGYNADYNDGGGSWTLNSDYIFCKSVADGQIDTQPDVFSFNLPGRNGKFFFDQKGNIHTMPYQNIKIEYFATIGSTTYLFVITDEKGNQFCFNDSEFTTTTIGNCSTVISGSSIPTITRSLYLTKIFTPQQEEIDFNYDSNSYDITNQVSETRYWYSNVGLVDSAHFDPMTNCKITSSSSIVGLRLSSIINVTTGDKVVLSYENTSRKDLKNTRALSQIEVLNSKGTSIKKFTLLHDYFNCSPKSNSDELNFRLKLLSIQQKGQQPYSFVYNSQTLPSRLSFAQDHWGNYNGALDNTTLLPNEGSPQFGTGANREPDTTFMKAGILTKIIYPTGGSTAFSYEGNDTYIDKLVKTWYNDDAGAGANVNATVTKTFKVEDNSEGFLASWTTTDDGSTTASYSTTGDNTFITLTGPNNYNAGFTANSNGMVKFPGNDPQQNSDPTKQCILVPGDYTITIENQSQSGIATGGLVIGWKYFVMQHIQQNVLAGGLRIRAITDYPVNGIPKTKFFEYNSNSEPAKSSGAIVFAPSYDHDFFTYQKSNVGQTTSGVSMSVVNENHVKQADYLAQSSNSVSPLGTMQGGSVAYGNVNVYTNDKNEGFTSNEFSFGGIPVSNANYDPYAPAIPEDWLYGLPIKTIHYKYNLTKQSYFPVEVNKKTYKTTIGDGTSAYTNTGIGINSNEAYVRGIKISYKYPEWSKPNDGEYDYDFFSNNEAAVFYIGYYYLYSSWSYLTEDQTTQYDQDGNNPVTTTTNYYYDNPTHAQLTRTAIIDSKGKTLTQFTTYPDDYASGTTFLDNMKTNHLVSLPIEQTSYLTDGTNTSITGGTVTQYQAGGKGLVDQLFKLTTNVPISQSSFKFSNVATGKLPYNNTAGTYILDSHYQSRLTYNSYDNLGNPLMITPVAGTPISYLWDYNNNPIAEVHNAASASVAYSSFEDDNSSWVYSSSGVISTDSHTGTKCYTGTISKSSLPQGNYIVGFWAKGGGIITIGSTTKSIAASWTYYQVLIDNITSISISTGDNFIDDLRLYPQGAQMTTYTYNPLVGMTSQTDAGGHTIYYEYDDFQRLLNIKDQNGKIVKSFCYNYAGQSGNCVINTTQSAGSGNDSGTTTGTGSDTGSGTTTGTGGGTTAGDGSGSTTETGSSSTTYYNAVNSKSYTATCGKDYQGSTVTYTVAANTYSSVISQADADQKAADDQTSNGQNYANQNGKCTQLITFNFSNSTGTAYQAYFTPVNGNSITVNLNNQGNTSTQIPAGTYSVQVYPPSGPYDSSTVITMGARTAVSSPRTTFSNVNVNTGSSDLSVTIHN